MQHRTLAAVRGMQHRGLLAVAPFLLLFAAPLAAAAGVMEGDASEARTIEVHADEYAFTPSTLHARAGRLLHIVLHNDGEMRHNLTFPGIAQGTPTLEPGETAILSLELEEPGTYRFECTMTGHHEAGLRGNLIVEAPSRGEGGGAPQD